MNFSPTLYRGESRVMTLTVVDPDTGLPANLASGKWQVTAIEWQVKPSVGDPDPPTISHSLGAGIALQAQTGATLGKLDVFIDPADTVAVAPGSYTHDVVAVFASGARVYLVKPSGLPIVDVVNQM